MHDERMKMPPLAKRPSGVLLPPTNRNGATKLPSAKGSTEKEGLEVCLLINGSVNNSHTCFAVAGTPFQSATVS
jgi:hypothetical protein